MKESVFLIANLLKIPFKFELSPAYDISNEFITFRDIKIQSHIDYLSEYGIVISKDSKNVSDTFNVIIYANSIKKKPTSFHSYSQAFSKSDKLDNYQFNSIFIPNSFTFDLGNDKSEINFFKMNYKLEKPDIASSFSDLESSNKHASSFFFLNGKDQIIQNDSNSLTFSVSNYSFFLLKHFFAGEKSTQLIFHYSEIDKTPFWIQVFVHLPVLMLFMTIFIMIAWFESGASDSIIEDEISKLPVQKYNSSLGISDCSICLDSFSEDQNVKVLNCKHCFHHNCIDSWLRNMLRCPICRKSVSKIAESSSYQLYQALNSM